MTGKIQIVPWLLAAATAIWFGLMARKAGRNWFSWALAGAVFGLITTTIVLGLGQAIYNPFSNQDRTILHVKLAVAATVIIALLGWLITMGLHRHHLTLWYRVAKTPPPAPPSPPASPAKTKPEAPKQTPGRA